MVTTLIQAYPKEIRPVPTGSHLQVAECFTDTIQGEGVSTGRPATFLRMQTCTLACAWCDTLEVWKRGNPYSITELITLFKEHKIIDSLEKQESILVLTGGSPLKQQQPLIELLIRLFSYCTVKPWVEIENECTLFPDERLDKYISQWNNSPKLSNSRMAKSVRYKPDLIYQLAQKPNSWFKFVVESESDWDEIEQDFILPRLISTNQVILMPQGQTREELSKNREKVLDIATRHKVRFTDRLHITIWDKKTGV